MKYTHLLVLVFSVLFLSACSSSTGSVAGDGSADTSTAKAQSAEAVVASQARDDGYRCERVQVTGTRLTQKYCSTAKQREATAAAAASAAANISRRATQAGGPTSN